MSTTPARQLAASIAEKALRHALALRSRPSVGVVDASHLAEPLEATEFFKALARMIVRLGKVLHCEAASRAAARSGTDAVGAGDATSPGDAPDLALEHWPADLAPAPGSPVFALIKSISFDRRALASGSE